MPLSAAGRSTRRATAAFVAFCTALLVMPSAAGAQAQRFVGTIRSVDANLLTVQGGDGSQTRLRLPDGARITARSRTDWSAVVPGGYVGTTAVPQADGTLLAKEVHVFTEAQRGTGEGHYPMATPGDTMTNATVSRMDAPTPRDTMTNATVAGARDGGAGHRLTLTYKGGKQNVVVPDDVPIIASAPGDRTLLVPGAHVVAYAKRETDGGLTIERISVGKDGFATPI